VPKQIQALAAKTSQQSALAWTSFNSGGTPRSGVVDSALSRLMTSADSASAIGTFEPEAGRALANYLRQPAYGLFFDPTKNHDAWFQPEPLPEQVATSSNEFVIALDARFPPRSHGDAAAEMLEADVDEIEVFRNQIKPRDFEVPDSMATVKTRGSAQKAFADEVKSNYGFKCAITGIETKDFLVAAHVVPWSEDQRIRLDPANGICLSLILDRAFEKGYTVIEDDLSIRIDWDRIGKDSALRTQLQPYDGKKLRPPRKGQPKPEYLQRRRAMALSTGSTPSP
jgi:hypothetical protein